MRYPETIEEAIAMARGPLGTKMSEFPLLFANPVTFGLRSASWKQGEINNGTISIVDLGKGAIGITCHHLIEHYRDRCKKEGDMIFGIRNVELDPLAQLIDENEQIDIATIRLTEAQIREITSCENIGSCIFQPKSWPPPPIEVGDYIVFGGFPGGLRTEGASGELVYYSWSSGGSEVSSVSDFKFLSAFNRDRWVSTFGEKYHMDLQALGGMSGGPAFIHRGLYWDFVGIFSEYQESYDAAVFSLVRNICADGTIETPSM